MAKQQTDQKLHLNGVRRTTAGTSSAHRLRAQGLIPGVVYGRKTEAMAIAVDGRELGGILHSEAGEHALLTLRVTDEAPQGKRAAQKTTGAGWEKPVLIKQVQHHAVEGHVLHVDFHAIVLTERIRVKVPVELQGEPVGVKEQDGLLEHFMREVEVECLPTNIPKNVALDVSQLSIGDAVHVRDLPTPPDATITDDPEGVIASVLAPKEEKVEEEEVATEPEVISEKKEEAAEGEGEGTKAAEAESKPKDTKGEKKGE